MDAYYQPHVGLLQNPRLYSTIRAILVDEETNETVEALYDEAAKYQADIAREMAAFRTTEYPTNNLMAYFELPDDPDMEKRIKQKVRAARPTVQAEADTLYGVLELELTEDLTDQEFLCFIEQIRSQYRDGWGAEFEMLNIHTDSKDMVTLCLYHPDIEFYTADAFDRMLQQKKEQEDLSAAKAGQSYSM